MNFQNITAGTGATQIIQVKPEDLQPNFFKTSNYESYKNDPNPVRVPGTCEWFLEHPTFQKWKASSGDDLLWLSADPGCGKSVLSRALVDEKLISVKPVTLCYFFFKDNEEQNSIATALCALLHQLFWAHDGLLANHAAPAINRCGEVLKKEEEELWRTFISAATDPAAGDVVCILDALDECKKSDRNKLIHHLEKFHERSENGPKRESQLKFFVTSRPYSNIEDCFSTLTQNIPTIRLAGEDESDKISHEIGIVIEAKVNDIAERHRLSQNLRIFLQKKLCEIPNRTYLWLHLTLDEVRSKISKGKTEKRLLAIIGDLSSTVEDAYEAILKSGDQDEGRRILQIVVAARRPLTLGEIDMALEIREESTSYEDLDLQYEGRKESIRANCGLFISIVDGRVFLIHQTAREFLIRKNIVISEPHRWKHSIDLEEAHWVLSKKCVAYLLFHELQQRSTINTHSALLRPETEPSIRLLKEKHSFLDYSAKNWISHVQEAGNDSAEWIPKTSELCNIGYALSCTWFRIYEESDFRLHPYRDTEHTALYWAVLLGLVNETRFHLNHSWNSENKHDSVQDILKGAAGNLKYGTCLVKLMLEQLGEVKITEQVVQAAAQNWQSGKDIMALLLDRRGDQVQITEQVVEAAAQNRQSGKDIMALLLDRRGDQVQITEQVVEAAAQNWQSGKDIMALLLNRQGDQVKITEQVVEAAAKNRQSGKDIMKLLLNRQGNENAILLENLSTKGILEKFSPRLFRARVAGDYVYIHRE